MNKTKAAISTYVLYRKCGWTVFNALKKAWRLLK